ncbi:MAG: periplasmic heavy metal sensor [Paracoccaceae bacterium]|nr:MAG: periplasmic heavy metal sensor [Paracoccaceae bacterium]
MKATPPRAPGRWLRVALAVSVALNLAVAGVIVGAVVRDGPPRGAAMRDFGLGPVAGALSDADRAALRRAFAARAPDLRAMRSGWRQDTAALVAVLRAEPFDPQAMRDTMESGARRVGDMIALSRGLLVDHVATMDPAARRAFAERLEAIGNRRGPSRDQRSDRP